MIRVSELTVRQERFALENVSFEVPTGCYAVLMGRTGCGKTTLIEAICGLRRVVSGQIQLHGRNVTDCPPGARNIGYVPQDAALFDTMSVRDHLTFALRIRREKRERITQRIAEMAELLGIDHLLDRSTRRLSGGERQRVALGRALAFQPNTILLDEPLSALDDDTRQSMYQLLHRVKAHTHVTALHVTHNEFEAKAVGDLQLRFHEGKVYRL